MDTPNYSDTVSEQLAPHTVTPPTSAPTVTSYQAATPTPPKRPWNFPLLVVGGVVLVTLGGVGGYQLARQDFLDGQRISETTMNESELFPPCSALPNEASLPNDFWVFPESMLASDAGLFFFTTDDHGTSDERHLLMLPFCDVTGEGTTTALPWTKSSYPSVKAAIVADTIYVFGFQSLPTTSDFPEYASQATALMGKIAESGTVEQWQELSVGLPPNIPKTNGGYYLKTDGTHLFAVVVDDSPQHQVYKLETSNQIPSAWVSIGTVPAGIIGSYGGGSNSVHFQPGRVFVVSDTQIQAYIIENGLISAQSAVKSIDFPPFEFAAQERHMYLTIRENRMYMLAPMQSDSQASLALWRADLGADEVRFEQLDQKPLNTDLDHMGEIEYMGNDSHLFAVRTRLDQFNKPTERTLMVFPLE